MIIFQFYTNQNKQLHGVSSYHHVYDLLNLETIFETEYRYPELS